MNSFENFAMWKIYSDFFGVCIQSTYQDLFDCFEDTFGGEYEVFDENHNWIMRIRDDDPFIFLASYENISIDDKELSKYIMEVPASFHYCY